VFAIVPERSSRAAASTNHEYLVEEALTAFSDYFLALRQSVEPIWAQLDLTISQLKAIILLDVNGPMTIGTLGNRLGIGRPSASILTDQLVQLDLVERVEDKQDRRRTLVHMTRAGSGLVLHLLRGNTEMMRYWYECLSDEDLDALQRGFRALAGAIASTSSSEA
jgi:DNA-binding MarR family transcriptional regulator